MTFFVSTSARVAAQAESSHRVAGPTS